MKQLLCIIFFVCIGAPCLSQVREDSAYIISYPQQLTTRLYLSQKYTSINYHKTGSHPTFIFMPNSTLNLGAGATLYGITVNLSYGFNFLNPQKENHGNTQHWGVQWHYYGRKWLTDFSADNYKGFYWANNKDNPEYVRPDVNLTQLGAVIQYVLNGSQFSHRAAYSMDEWQIKSAGSLILGGNAYYNYITADSALVFNTPQKNRQIYRNMQVGASVGYAYTFVIKQHFFISATLLAGLDLTFSNLRVEPFIGKQEVNLHPALFPRFSIGYNSHKWSINILYTNDKITIANKGNENINLNNGNYRLVFSYRFDYKFTKRGWWVERFFPELKD